MRYLGADPRVPADDMERAVRVRVHKYVVGMKNRAAKEARNRG
jgi:hypothetical protein